MRSLVQLGPAFPTSQDPLGASLWAPQPGLRCPLALEPPGIPCACCFPPSLERKLPEGSTIASPPPWFPQSLSHRAGDQLTIPRQPYCFESLSRKRLR